MSIFSSLECLTQRDALLWNILVIWQRYWANELFFYFIERVGKTSPLLSPNKKSNNRYRVYALLHYVIAYRKIFFTIARACRKIYSSACSHLLAYYIFNIQKSRRQSNHPPYIITLYLNKRTTYGSRLSRPFHKTPLESKCVWTANRPHFLVRNYEII